MTDLKICRICLRTEAKMFNFNWYQLKCYYEEVMALEVSDCDDLPHYFCYECSMLLYKFHKFKEKCYNGIKAFREILWHGQLTYEAVHKLKRERFNLQPVLEVMMITNRVKGFAVNEENKLPAVVKNEEFEEHKHPIIDYVPEEIQDDYVDNFSDHDAGIETEIKAEPESLKLPKLVSAQKQAVNKKTDRLKLKKKRKVFLREKKMGLDPKNWKISNLSEEEAVEEFRKRSQAPKYLNAAFPCINCYKGFSKVDMLHRHIRVKHEESLGPNECNFCHMRFKWKCHLRRHMREHYTKYECLECGLVCPLEATAFLHEEYHSGVLRKCCYCDEKFRHSSTFYTHIRTAHKSEHVCSQCGVSFVSELGLKYHKTQKHPYIEVESSDDFEDTNTYCKKCEIRFETKKAFQEHIYHSVLHEEGIVGDNILLLKRKVVRRERNKIGVDSKRKRDKKISEEFQMIKPRKRGFRVMRKPTTCYQCGKSFETQAAAMKHHAKEHPGTSFYDPNQRVICEICGASLAPGSVNAHENNHSRQKMYSCQTCGRSFTAKVTLNRHMRVHTGEKPFKCTLCDKRFTQSNSMKLHYKTFHLKLPYPKRNRNKKKETLDPVTNNMEEKNQESETFPEQEQKVSRPDADMLYLNFQ